MEFGREHGMPLILAPQSECPPQCVAEVRFPQTARFKGVAFRPHQAHQPGLESAPGDKHNSGTIVGSLRS